MTKISDLPEIPEFPRSPKSSLLEPSRMDELIAGYEAFLCGKLSPDQKTRAVEDYLEKLSNLECGTQFNPWEVFSHCVVNQVWVDVVIRPDGEDTYRIHGTLLDGSGAAYVKRVSLDFKETIGEVVFGIEQELNRAEEVTCEHPGLWIINSVIVDQGDGKTEAFYETALSYPDNPQNWLKPWIGERGY